MLAPRRRVLCCSFTSCMWCCACSPQLSCSHSVLRGAGSAKQLVGLYPAMCIAAWAYITAAIAMGTTAVLFVEPPGWELPAALMGPLAYWILICSVLGYYIVTWATQHLPASQARPAAGRRAHTSQALGPLHLRTVLRNASSFSLGPCIKYVIDDGECVQR